MLTCSDGMAHPILGIFVAGMPTILYYSHLPIMAFALFLGIFALVKDHRSPAAQFLFLFSIIFALWGYADLHAWTEINILSMTFAWNTLNPFFHLMFISLGFFCYSFIEGKYPPAKTVIPASIIVMTSCVLMNTTVYIDYFNNGLCESHATFWGAMVFANIVTFIICAVITGYFILRYRKTVDPVVKEKIRYLSASYIIFYILLIGTDYLGSVTLDWTIAQYGLFGTVAFLGALLFLITKYGAFNVKFFGVQTLVWVAGALIASLLFLGSSNLPIIRLITITTFILLLIFGIILIRSVRREIEQREELKRLTDELKGFNDHLEEKIEAQKTEIQKRYETEKRSGEEAKILSNAKTEFILSFQERFGKPADDVIHTLKEVSRGTSGALATALEKAVNASDRFRKLISELGNIATIKERAAAMQKAPTDMRGLIEEIKNDLQADLEAKKLTTNIMFDESAQNARPTVDGRLIKEAMYNILDNAVKYTMAGGITVKAETKDNKLIITIKDTGIGMTKEEQGKIFFSAFERGEEAKTMYVTGRGIGLMLTKNIVEAHGGTIRAESHGRGEGTTITIELPV